MTSQQHVDGDHPSVKYDTVYQIIELPANTVLEDQIEPTAMIEHAATWFGRLMDRPGCVATTPPDEFPFGWFGSVLDASGVRCDLVVRMVPRVVAT